MISVQKSAAKGNPYEHQKCTKRAFSVQLFVKSIDEEILCRVILNLFDFILLNSILPNFIYFKIMGFHFLDFIILINFNFKYKFNSKLNYHLLFLLIIIFICCPNLYLGPKAQPVPY